MASFKMTSRGGRIYIRCKINPEYYVSGYEMHCLKYFSNKNLMKCDYKKQELLYEGNGKRTIRQIINYGMSYSQAVEMIRQLESLWNYSRMNHLQFDKIVFHPDYVIVDSQTGVYQFMYYPVNGEQLFYNVGLFLLDQFPHIDMSEGVRRTWREVLFHASNLTENTDWGKVFSQMLRKKETQNEADDEPLTGFDSEEEEAPTGFDSEEEEAPTGFDSEEEEAPTGFDSEEEEAPTGFDSEDEEITGFEEDDWSWNRSVKYPVIIRCSTDEKTTIKKNRFVIGRSGQRADFCISDNPKIGNVHAIILFENGRYYLVDNESRNGTYVGGMRIAAGEKIELYNGETFQLYDEEFTFNC